VCTVSANGGSTDQNTQSPARPGPAVPSTMGATFMIMRVIEPEPAVAIVTCAASRHPADARR
jgi:hypothetical protein